MTRGIYMNSTFSPRDLPSAIMLRDEHAVFGPFCIHCGAPQVEHESGSQRCPAVVSPMYPLPICGCHVRDLRNRSDD